MALSIPIMNPVRFRDNSKRPDYDNTFPLPDTQQIGQLMEEGVYPGSFVQDWIKNKDIVLQLRTTTTAPDLIAVRANQSNLITGWESETYDTFTSSNTKITSAINLAGTAFVWSDTFTVYEDEVITVIVNLDLNSDQVPSVAIDDLGGLGTISNIEALSNGANTITLTSTASVTTARIRINNSAASNFETSNIEVLKSYRTTVGVDITPAGWTGDDVYKYTFTPDFEGLFYMFLEDTNYITDYLYVWNDSASYKSNFISGVDGWAVTTDGGSNTTISNINEKLSLDITAVGTPVERPVIEFAVDASFAGRDWVLKIKANTGLIDSYETDDGSVSVELTLNGTEQIILGNGIGASNKIYLSFDSTDAPYQTLIEYVTVEARENIIPKRRLVEIDFQNTSNDYGMVFFDTTTLKYTGKILLTGRMLDPQPANDSSVFESDRGQLEKLRSTPKKIYLLKITDTHRAMVDQINHIFACDTLTINGEFYQNPESIEVEPIEGSDLVNINATIQQVDNDYFI